MRNMTEVRWKNNQVISIETKRKDESKETRVYVLAQMIGKAELLFFYLFNTDNNWDDVDLPQVPILFCATVARQFIKSSNIFRQNIKGIENYISPKRKIDPLGMGSRWITLWEGTPNEKKILIIGDGGGRLFEVDTSSGKYNERDIIASINRDDLETINSYELRNVRIYAELNERLYLCYKMGRNVDPLKDLVFNLPIPLEYKEYIEIIST